MAETRFPLVFVPLGNFQQFTTVNKKIKEAISAWSSRFKHINRYREATMLSIVTDEGLRTDLRGHAAAPTPKSVKIVEPSAPSALKPSGQAQAPSKGRQIRQGHSVAESSTDGPKKRARAQTMEELDRRVENDALELLNMKKDIQEQQKLEVKNAMKTLMGIKKEYDVLRQRTA